MAKRTIEDFPAHYACRVDELVNEYAAELRDYVLAMVEVAEGPMADRQHFRQPDQVLTLALEGFGLRLAERMANRRKSEDALNELKSELGL